MKLYEMVLFYDILYNGELVVVYVGIKVDDIGKYICRVKDFVFYGDVMGEMYLDGRFVRCDWVVVYNGKVWVVYGYIFVKEFWKVNCIINIDIGCVFGNKLIGFCFLEIEVVFVLSFLFYDELRFCFI